MMVINYNDSLKMMNNNAVFSYVPKISVIIPVYNSELYLERCLDSIINQSLKDIQIILVDDGSKDRSAEICDTYSYKDQRIVVVHQENKGICGARNAGLKLAAGEYIAFCDNDDWVDPNCYKNTYNYAKENNADIVRFRRKHTIIGKMGRVSTSYSQYPNQLVIIRDWSDYLQIVKKTGYGVWAGIYKKSIIALNEIEFDTRTKYGYEDNIFSSMIYRYAKRVYLIHDELYEWIQRVSHSASMKKGYTVFLNRLEGMLIWKSVEDLLFNAVTDNDNLHKERVYDYLRMVIEEIQNSGLKGKSAKFAIIHAKEKLGFIPKRNPNYEEWLINHNYLKAFMLSRYIEVIKRKFVQIIRKK